MEKPGKLLEKINYPKDLRKLKEKDLQQVVIWAGAFLGNTVDWRGQKMRLRRDGTLIAKK